MNTPGSITRMYYTLTSAAAHPTWRCTPTESWRPPAAWTWAGGSSQSLTGKETVTYVSPVLKRGAMWASPRPLGKRPRRRGSEPVIRSMVEALEQAAGLRPGRDRLDAFLTQGTRWEPRAVPVVSLLRRRGRLHSPCPPGATGKAYGDIGACCWDGPSAASPAFQGAGRFRGEETIRATVVGAGEPSTRAVRFHHLTHRDMAFPRITCPSSS